MYLHGSAARLTCVTTPAETAPGSLNRRPERSDHLRLLSDSGTHCYGTDARRVQCTGRHPDRAGRLP